LAIIRDLNKAQEVVQDYDGKFQKLKNILQTKEMNLADIRV
jgi:hypothetical protein